MVCCLRPPGADRAAAALVSRAAVDPGPPHMAKGTPPPHVPSAPRRHLLRRQIPIQRRMPLHGHKGLRRGQVVVPRQHLPPCTVGAPGFPLRPGGDGRLPAVAFPAPPPGLPVAVRGYLFRRQSAVFLSVPLGGDLRVQSGEVVLPRDHHLPRAHRTPLPVGTGRRCGLPDVALPAHPPHPLVAPGGDPLRGKGQISFRMPLCSQVGT